MQIFANHDNAATTVTQGGACVFPVLPQCLVEQLNAHHAHGDLVLSYDSSHAAMLLAQGSPTLAHLTFGSGLMRGRV